MALKLLKPTIRTADLRIARPAPKERAEHYGTADHRAWASAVVRRAGGACQACGRDHTRLFADHIIELRDGGPPLDLANGQALCGACHSTKTAKAKREREARR